MIKNVIIIYLLLINAAGFLLMGTDKYKAARGRWRIPEKTLFLLALLGGSVGSWIGMYTFHHKTRHWYFKWGMPFILVVQCALIYRFAVR